MRLRLAVLAGRACAAYFRAASLPGSGTIAGRVVLALAPDALLRLTASRAVVLVSGTNGKTTTTRMICEALRGTGRVASNDTGANMPAGLVTALVLQRRTGYAVLEVDERYLALACAQTRPAAVVLLNLSRDQLDRNPETALVARAWREIPHGPATRVVANCDDPNVYWAAARSPLVTWVSMGDAWHDAWWCPACGQPLTREASGTWACLGCGLERPDPDWLAEGRCVTCVRTGESYKPELRLPGRVNVANAAMALAVAASLGQPVEPTVTALEGVESIAGRYGVTEMCGRRVRLLLAKNPASWAEIFRMIKHSPGVLLVLNARELDGQDTSWIWDVDFRELAGQTVLVTGERRLDLAVRLDLAEVEFKLVSSLEEACALAPTGPLDVVANYTAFLDLVRRFGPGSTRTWSRRT
ncbi:MurT ligase domain-containing protein [Nonomuraea helvata]|uniref:Lipid II isoglutaminyl synthase (glutamine-hydrolyzing) subunit MurT n=1 Tax=Nonomuraea helvata TaxID=37484 RepID=A0ABV5SC33_9ACTN